jgi:ABC-2 type transport system ATP-binding protein
VKEHLLFAAKLRNLNKVETKNELDKLVSTLNLSSKLNRLSGKLSLGSKRLAALALALLGGPSLLILDEPSSSLDPDGVRRLNLALKALTPETTLIIASHVLREARFLTDRLIVLNEGKVAAFGNWDDLSEKYGLSGEKKADVPQKIFFKALEGK